jgi:hypothetical protein
MTPDDIGLDPAIARTLALGLAIMLAPVIGCVVAILVWLIKNWSDTDDPAD